MADQEYKNHVRILPFWHLVILPLLLFFFIAALADVYFSWQMKDRMLAPVLMFILSFILFVLYFKARGFALQAQDRAIRAEENLRYFAITGNLLDSKLSIKQIVALRFAPNNEFVDLAHRAVAENLSPKEIKKLIVHWKADYDRV